ncbi:MAG: DUF4832 domain-containing protein [Roseiflexaceae bacterium]
MTKTLAARAAWPIAALALLLAVALTPLLDAQAQTNITITPTVIPLSAPEIVNPMRGYYRWYGSEPIPQPRPSYDHYVRYGWRQLEPSRGQYDFSALEQAMQAAKASGARFSFRVMAVNEYSSPIEVPSYLQKEAGGRYCSFNGTSMWVPTWDNPAFIERARALMQALGGRFNGDPRLGYYDMGIYGHWGEWHTSTLCTPPASDATKRALVEMQIDAFPNSRILMNSGASEVMAFVYALGRSPRIGVRVDSLCNPWFDEQFYQDGEKLAAMKDRWKTAPMVAEFFNPRPDDISLCQRQVQNWHVAAIGNGPINWTSYNADQQSQMVTLGKLTGYRFALTSLTYPAAAPSNSQITLSAQWRNNGVTPAYEPFDVTFELQPKGQSMIAWRAVSQLDLQQLLPSTTPQAVVDQAYLPTGLAPGVYTLSVVVRDSTGYRPPLALAIQGGSASGRYTLGDITIQPGTPGLQVFLPTMRRS